MAQSRYHHKEVKDICRKLHEAMIGPGTWETQVWRQLYRMQHYALWSYVSDEWNKNWCKYDGKCVSLYDWMRDEFSRSEWKWTYFMWMADGKNAWAKSAFNRDVEAMDGIPVGQTYKAAMPLTTNSAGWKNDTIRDTPQDSDIITVVWQARKIYGTKKLGSARNLAVSTDKGQAETMLPDDAKVELGYAYFTETPGSPEEKASNNDIPPFVSGEYADRKEVWRASEGKDGMYHTALGSDWGKGGGDGTTVYNNAENKGEIYYVDGNVVERKPMVHRFYKTLLWYGGKPTWTNASNTWWIVWVDIPKTTFKGVKLSKVKGWCMCFTGPEAAKGNMVGLNPKAKDSDKNKDYYNDPLNATTGNYRTLAALITRARTGGAGLINSGSATGAGFGMKPFKWRMLGDHIHKPGFKTRTVDRMNADMSNGNFDLPGKIVTWKWTTYDRGKISARDKAEWEHAWAYDAAATCFKLIYNWKPETLYKTLMHIYAKCSTYPDIIERTMYCYYYFFPLNRRAPKTDNTWWFDFSNGDTEGAGGLMNGLQNYRNHNNEGFFHWRTPMNEAILKGMEKDTNEANTDWWNKCIEATQYAGLVTWDEESSYGDVTTIGPKKVWGSSSIRSNPYYRDKHGWEKEGDLIPETARSNSQYDPFWEWKYENDEDDTPGSESAGLFGEYEYIEDPVAFSFGWYCQDVSGLNYPSPEPLDIEPQEPPPAYLNGVSVPAYDNVPLDWMGALTLVDSVVNGVKGLGREFAGVSSGGDLGDPGNSAVNEANQAAKSSADPTTSATQAHQNAAQGNTMTTSSEAAPADSGGNNIDDHDDKGNVDDYNNKVDGLLSDLRALLGDNNLYKLAALLAELAKKFPHLQKLIMAALEAMMNGQFGLLLSVCKQILGMNIDDPLIAQIKALCNSNVTDFYGTPGAPGEIPSTEGNLNRIIDVMAEAQLPDNEVLAGKYEPMEPCLVDE